MHWLDRTLTSASTSLLALALVGCSDDGLAPPANTGTAASTSGVTGNDAGEDPDAGTTAAGEGPDAGTTTTGPEGTGSATGFQDDGPCPDASGCPPPETGTCEDPDQCVLINDCCQCAAAHIDDKIPECPMDCLQPLCDALGVPDIEVTCEDGSCELVQFDCSGITACDSLPPRCAPGTLPEVAPDGTCWTGACLPVAACETVPDCEACPDDQACVQEVTMLGPSFSCRAMPEACGGVATCDCMPPDTCEAPFDTCEDADGVIICSCPVC